MDSLCLSVIFGINVTVIEITFMTLFESSFDADHNGRTPSFISQSHTKVHTICLRLPLDNNRMFAVMWTPRTELSNVHFSIAVHQNTSSDLPDIHVKQPQRQ